MICIVSQVDVYNLFTMRSFHRHLLVFLLLVVIPFQGVASTLMFACEMSHGLKQAVSVHAQVMPHDHNLTVQSTQSSPDGHHPLDLTKVSDQDDQRSFSAELHKNHLKHNTCCSSTAAGAVTSAMLVIASPDSNCADFTYLSSLYLPPVLAGLDRPPQLTLA